MSLCGSSHLRPAPQFLRNLLPNIEVSRAALCPCSGDRARVHHDRGQVALAQFPRHDPLATRYVKHAAALAQKRKAEGRLEKLVEFQTAVHCKEEKEEEEEDGRRRGGEREHTLVRRVQLASSSSHREALAVASCPLTVAFRCALPRVALLPLLVEQLLLLLDA